MASSRLWAVMPAAGSGRRMAAAQPKQYLSLGGTPVLQRSIDALLQLDRIEKVVVALAEDDQHWPSLEASRSDRVATTAGGAERSDSVVAGLRALAAEADRDDWVLVHDAARPCLRRTDLERLVESLADDPVGGLLAIPVAETVKRADGESRVLETVPRESLWLAQTPQLFRYGLLLDALLAAQQRGEAVTDEAAAVEAYGSRPKLVAGDPGNIKITRPEDLPLAERYLLQEEN